MSIQTGICGTNLEYTLDTETGMLNITPKEGTTGPYNMDDYGYFKSPPWSDYMSEIRTVNIPLEINKIGDYAFNNASNLDRVVCENEKDCLLSHIGEDAFSYTSLRYFPVLSNISYIGESAFSNTHLREFDLSKLNSSLLTIGNRAFEYTPVIINVNSDKTSSVVESIINFCKSEYVPYDDGGSSSSSVAFESTEKLSLYWNGDMTVYDANTDPFDNTNNRKYIPLIRKALVKSYEVGWGSNPLSKATLVTDIILDDVPSSIDAIANLKDYPKKFLDNLTFNFKAFNSKVQFWSNCFRYGSPTSVHVNTIYNNTKEECLKQWLALDFKFTTGDYSYEHPKPEYLYFAGSLVEDLEIKSNIGYYQFTGCKSIKKVTINPTSIVTIAPEAFLDAGIEELYVGNNVSSIGEKSFYGCDSLKIATIPFEGKTATSTGKEARLPYVFGASSIENLTLLPSSRNIFYGNTGIADYKKVELKTLNLPDNISTVDTNAFYGMSKLTELRLPNNLTTIDFEGASALTTLLVNSIDHFLKINITNNFIAKNVYFEDILTYSNTMDIVCAYSSSQGASTFNSKFDHVYVNSFATPVYTNSQYVFAKDIYYIKNKVTIEYGSSDSYHIITGSTLSDETIEASKIHTYRDIQYSGETVFYTYSEISSGSEDNEMIFHSDYTPGHLFSYASALKPWSSYLTECKSILLKGSITSIPDDEFNGMSAITTFTLDTNKDSGGNINLSLGKRCFSGCSSLSNVSFLTQIPSSNNLFKVSFPDEGFVFDQCTSLGASGVIYLDSIINASSIKGLGANFNGCTSISSISFANPSQTDLHIENNILYSSKNIHATLKWVPCGVRDSVSNSIYIQPQGSIQYIDAVEKNCFSGGTWERIIFQRNLSGNSFPCELLTSSIYDCNGLSQNNVPKDEQDQSKNGIVCFNKDVSFRSDSIYNTNVVNSPTIVCYEGSTADLSAQELNYSAIIIYIKVQLYCDEIGFIYSEEDGGDVILHSYLDKVKQHTYTDNSYYVNNSTNNKVKLTGKVSNGEITPLENSILASLAGVESNALKGFKLDSGKTINFIITDTNNSIQLQNNCFSNAPGIGSITIPDNSIIVSNNTTDLITSSIFFNSNNISSIAVNGNHENPSVYINNNILYANLYGENNAVSGTVLMYSPPVREDTDGILTFGTANYINKYAFCRCVTTKYFNGTNNDGLLFINKEANKKILFRVPEDYTLNNEKITSIVVDKDIAEIETFAFNHCDHITEITILNSECLFPKGTTYFNKNVILRGYWDSTTEKYANEHNLIFKAINKKKFNLQSQDHYISVLINGDPGSFPLVRDTTVLDEFFRYILPTGYIVDYEFNSNVQDTTTEIEVKSSISTLEGVQQYKEDDSGKYIPYWNDKGQELDQPSNVAYNIRNFETESQNLSEKSADTLTLGNIVNLEEQKDSGK